MNELSKLTPPDGSKKKKKRVGRGESSGFGKTSGRGHKGLKSRSGGNVPPEYEGGQMPLIRRLPKRGFNSPNRKSYTLISLKQLATFEGGSVVDLKALMDKGIIRGARFNSDGIKILANGEISVALTVKAEKFSKAAREKIEAAGGTVEVV